MNDYIVDVDALVDIARRNGCKTNTAIGERLNINRNIVGDILNRKRKPSADFMYRFVQEFNVAPEVAGLVFFIPNLRNT